MRETETAQVEGEVEREGERENPKQALCAASAEPNMGFNPQSHEIMTWAKTKSQMLNRLSHPGAPLKHYFLPETHSSTHYEQRKDALCINRNKTTTGLPLALCAPHPTHTLTQSTPRLRLVLLLLLPQEACMPFKNVLQREQGVSFIYKMVFMSNHIIQRDP